MMRTWIVALALISLTAILLAGCNDDTSPRVPGVFTVSLANLPELPDTLYYEAFVRFDTTTTARALHAELDAVSIGTFIVDGGQLRARNGGPATFGLAESRDLNRAADVLVSVRARDDTTVGAPLLGGIVGGDNEEGRANVTTTYHDALGDISIRTAAGTCILATPSTVLSTDENQGVWFVTSASTPDSSLTIPTLSESWRYGSWIVQSGDTLGLGHFARAGAADTDGAGPPGQAGPLPGFNAPGSDFVGVAPRSFNDSLATVLVTIQPASDETGPLSEDGPLFPIRVLRLDIPLGAATDSSMTLSLPPEALPSGDIAFTR